MPGRKLPGRADSEGTRAFRTQFGSRTADGHFRSDPDGRLLSSIGLGTYLGRPDAPTDQAVEEAVRVALSSGRVNVIDTAINYRFQRAERSVGRALAGLVASGRIHREMVFLATKGGYLAPDAEAPGDPATWVQRTLVDSGILRPADVVDGSHCMSAAYLADQFERSRTNLGVETIDLYYLHNAADAQLEVVGPAEFRERLRAAFRFLEGRRAAGELGSYGLATWDALRLPPDHPGHLDLEDALDQARAVGGPAHGFRFVQFPFNLAMPEAAVAATQRLGKTRVPLFDAARALGLGCFTSVPLLQGQLARPGPPSTGETPAQVALQFARSAPGALTALVGQKTAAHLAEDLSVADRAPWRPDEFARRLT